MSVVLPLQPLPWDSDFLGFGVARLVADHLLPLAWQQVQANAHAAACRLLYIVADPADATTAATLLAAGVRRTSRLVTYLADVAVLEELPVPQSDLAVRLTTHLTPALEVLAWESGTYSRFRLDQQLPPTVFRALYSEWLRKSLRGEEVAREVYSARMAEGQEIGLLTLGEQHGRADIGLLAVAASQRGLGIGRRLLATAGARARAWGYSQIQVVTQFENRSACQFYTQAGFEPLQQQDIYHFWLY